MKSNKSQLSLPPCEVSPGFPVKEVMVKLRNFIAKRCSNSDKVDDLVQETLIRTISRNDKEEIDNIHAYISQVAKSVMYTDWQKSINHPDNAQEIEQLSPESSDPEIHSINQQKIALVNEALQAMPALRREVFQLRRVEGLSRDEICQRLAISQESVKKHITRAMIQITLHIEKHQ